MRTLIALALVAAPLLADGNTATQTVEARVQFFAPVSVSVTGTFDLGKWVFNTSEMNANLVFVNGAITAGTTGCSQLVNSAAPTFPVVTVTKDPLLPVLVTMATEPSSGLAIDSYNVPANAGSAAIPVPINGHWSVTTNAVKTATVTVTAMYF